MIRRVTPDEATLVFELMSKIYASHSFLTRGIDAYCNELLNGRYVSFGYFESGQLLAHAGYRVHPEFALTNALVVDPAVRGRGVARALLEARLIDIQSNLTVDFVATYCMMQHLGSQRLYSDEFQPIGLYIGYPDSYHQSDAQYNRGSASNAEIVLCRRLSIRNYTAPLSLAPQYRAFAHGILAGLDVTARFDELSEADTPQHGTFLGFHPDVDRGLFTPAFLTSSVDFTPLLTSNPSRQAFVEVIRKQHENTSSYSSC